MQFVWYLSLSLWLRIGWALKALVVEEVAEVVAVAEAGVEVLAGEATGVVRLATGGEEEKLAQEAGDGVLEDAATTAGIMVVAVGEGVDITEDGRFGVGCILHPLNPLCK